MKYISDIAFTPAVKALQEENNSRKNYERMEKFGGWQSEVTPDLTGFLTTVDSFYMGTTNSIGQPYIQHRGGPQRVFKGAGFKTFGICRFFWKQTIHLYWEFEREQ